MIETEVILQKECVISRPLVNNPSSEQGSENLSLPLAASAIPMCGGTQKNSNAVDGKQNYFINLNSAAGIGLKKK
jgi:hypothetical protein